MKTPEKAPKNKAVGGPTLAGVNRPGKRTLRAWWLTGSGIPEVGRLAGGWEVVGMRVQIVV